MESAGLTPMSTPMSMFVSSDRRPDRARAGRGGCARCAWACAAVCAWICATTNPGHAQNSLSTAAENGNAAVRALVDALAATVVQGQRDDGGWGEGHSMAEIIPPGARRPPDPANTAFAALAILRAGNTLDKGKHAAALRRATVFILKRVEAAPERSLGQVDPLPLYPTIRVDPLTVTAQFGQVIDAVATALCLANLLDALGPQPSASQVDQAAALRQRIGAALDKCLRRIALLQRPSGTWAHPLRDYSTVAGALVPIDGPPTMPLYAPRGWAAIPTSTTAMACAAIEQSEMAGRAIDGSVIARGRAYLRTPFDPRTESMNVPIVNLPGDMHVESRDSGGRRPVPPVHFPYSGGPPVPIAGDYGIERVLAFAALLRSTAMEAAAARDAAGEAGSPSSPQPDSEVSQARLVARGLGADNALHLATAYQINRALRHQVDGGKRPLPGNEMWWNAWQAGVFRRESLAFAGFRNSTTNRRMWIACWQISESLVIAKDPSWSEWRDGMVQFLSREHVFCAGSPGQLVYHWGGESCLSQSLAILSLAADHDTRLTRQSKREEMRQPPPHSSRKNQSGLKRTRDSSAPQKNGG